MYNKIHIYIYICMYIYIYIYMCIYIYIYRERERERYYVNQVQPTLHGFVLTHEACPKRALLRPVRLLRVRVSDCLTQADS